MLMNAMEHLKVHKRLKDLRVTYGKRKFGKDNYSYLIYLVCATG